MVKVTKDVEFVLKDIHSAFDEKDTVPEIADFSNLERMRLVTALSKKYGDGMYSTGRARNAIKAFDSQMNFVQQLKRIKEGKNA